MGIQVPEPDRYFHHVACFDLEAMLLEYHKETRKTVFCNVHHPISCSIASSVEGFIEPKCIITDDPHSLVRQMFEYFQRIRQRVISETRDKWGGYLTQLKNKLEQRKKLLYARFCSTNSSTPTQESGVDPEEVYVKKLKCYYMDDPLFNQYLRLYHQFYIYMHRLPILTFNGQRYDVHLLNASLIKHLLSQEEQITDHGYDEVVYESEDEFVRMYGGDTEDWEDETDLDDMAIARFIDELKLSEMGKLRVLKRGNSYVSITNNNFSFLDVCNFLPAGSNYRSFVRAYASEGEKSFFPYEHVTSFERLQDTFLPDYDSDSWKSQLRGGANLLDEEYQDYLRDPQGGERPKSGEENYRDLQKLWAEKSFTCLRDLLEFYNNSDAKPFISALICMQNEYFAQKLDIWKFSVSVPGLARIKMMRFAQEQNILFPLIHKNDEDLFHLLKNSTTGGPSIIFNRLVQVGQTFLRPDKKYLANAAQGWDCNAMYAGAFRMPMPTGMYVRRFEDQKFEAKYRPHFFAMYVWLAHMSRVHGWRIKTRQTEGCDIRAGKYFLDGLAVGENEELIALEYNGCWAHNHRGCPLAKNSVNKDGYEKWEEKKTYLESQAYRVEFIWECKMNALFKSLPQLRAEMKDMKPQFFQLHPRGVNKGQILQGVSDGTFFGFLVCDLFTPEHLKAEMESFPPLFCNHDLDIEDVGPEMREYAANYDIKVKKRRLLLSGFAASEMLVSSRLLAFYIELGLVVTRVYQTVEFVKKSPFIPFVNEVTHQRKMAVKYPDRKIVGEIYKLMGRS